MSPLPMGTAILRRYVLLGPIGYGGVSTVYQAVDAVGGRVRAIKILAVLAGDRRARDDMRREAMITDRLRHPSVPRVYDYGDAVLPDGRSAPYVVLEFLNGVSLAGRLAGGPLPWPQAVQVAATAADVLAVAHLRGVVHRDLSPQNIMVTRNGIKIIDFGLASTISLQRPTPTPTATPAAARPKAGGGRSHRGHRGGERPEHGHRGGERPEHGHRGGERPEQRPAHPADDVYSLGVLLYQMVTGRSPYPSATSATFLAAGRTPSLAPTPVLAVAGLPRAVADLCRACMSKQASDRPTSADVALSLWATLGTTGLYPAVSRN